jgi:methyl-accepting chemotaxis protein
VDVDVKSRRKRWYQRRLIVNYPVQRMFVFYMIIMGIVLFCIGGLFSNLWLRILIFQDNGQILVNQRDYVLLGIVGSVVVVGCYVGFILSNRIVGPLFRLSREMKKAAEGEAVRPIAFRKNDYFNDLAKAFNKLLVRLAKAEGKKKEKKPAA